MSYDNQDTNAILDRNAGTFGNITMGWFRCLSYALDKQWFFLAGGNQDGAVLGTGNAGIGDDPNTIYLSPQTPPPQALVTSANTSWVFYCIVVSIGVGATVYWRFEHDGALLTVAVPDTRFVGWADLHLIGNPFFTNTQHLRCSAYKEWATAADLTPAQILAESAQKAPIVMTGIENYLSCDVGQPIGVDQSGAGQDWTVTGTITTNADEPIMVLPATSNGLFFGAGTTS